MKYAAGQKFHLLTLRKQVSALNSGKWEALCDCGETTVVRAAAAKRGEIKSCGCLLVIGKKTHGRSTTRLYQIWNGMIGRCHRPKSGMWLEYGAKGISVCKRWRDSFEAFAADMGEPPTTGHSIDRIDNSLGYEIGNCRWATASEQSRNRRNNRRITAWGERKLACEWLADERCAVCRPTLLLRIKRGWSPEMALSIPPKFHGKKPHVRPSAIAY